MRNAAFQRSEGMGWLRILANFVPQPVRPLARLFWSHFNWVKAIVRQPVQSVPSHGLPNELIVSLTSFPARFGTLHLTLRCLLSQSMKPNRVILWIAHDDVELLPSAVTRLQGQGLEIRTCDDLRSYKKLVPALKAFPNAFIVTADDDLYYPSDWLRVLVDEVQHDRSVIIGRRTVRLVREDSGRLAPFNSWEGDVTDEPARHASADLMCETGAGALFPPKSLHPIATDQTQFTELAPDGDDLWFYWCARLAGTLTKKAGKSLIVVPWRGTQKASLWASNEPGGNDEKIEALTARFGLVDQPLAFEVEKVSADLASSE